MSINLSDWRLSKPFHWFDDIDAVATRFNELTLSTHKPHLFFENGLWHYWVPFDSKIDMAAEFVHCRNNRKA